MVPFTLSHPCPRGIGHRSWQEPELNRDLDHGYLPGCEGDVDVGSSRAKHIASRVAGSLVQAQSLREESAYLASGVDESLGTALARVMDAVIVVQLITIQHLAGKSGSTPGSEALADAVPSSVMWAGMERAD